MIYLIDPKAVRYGAKRADQQFRTHLHIQQSRLRAIQEIKRLEPFEIENTTDLRQAVLATAIRLTLRSLAVHYETETVHHQRTLKYYPHAQYRVALTRTPTCAGHLGSLGYAAAKFQLEGDYPTVLQEIVHRVMEDHLIPNGTPQEQEAAMLKQLGFTELSVYLNQLETVLSAAIALNNPITRHYQLTPNDVDQLSTRLLLGVYPEELPIVIEYLQRISNRLNGQLPNVDPTTLYRLILRTYSFGYTAGPALIYQAVAVQALLNLYTLIPENQSLETVPAAAVNYFATAADVFTLMAQFDVVEYAHDYAEHYQKLTRLWQTFHNQEPDSVHRLLDYSFTATVETPTSKPISLNGLTLILSSTQTTATSTITFEVFLLSKQSTTVTVTLSPAEESEVSFSSQVFQVTSGRSKQVVVELSGEGTGAAVLQTNPPNELSSNTVYFEHLPLTLKP